MNKRRQGKQIETEQKKRKECKNGRSQILQQFDS